jgi:6-phosphogluconolactonase (cycloisomerase 2 family)
MSLALLGLAWAAGVPLPDEEDDGRLVSVRPMPDQGGWCEWTPAAARDGWRRVAGLVVPGLAAAQDTSADRAAIRTIHDPRATFSAVAVDPVRDEVILQDENLFQILVYRRLANTPPHAAMTEPKRLLAGLNTKLQFSCGLYVDPANGDIYTVDNDTGDSLSIFRHGAQGNVAPDRELHVPHGSYGIAVSENAREVFISVQHDNAVVVFRKDASGEEAPLRLIQGDRTGLADPHGVAVDEARGWLFVANHGSTHKVRADVGQASARGESKQNWPLADSRAVPGSGEFLQPSITVYQRAASGDAAPVGVIQGPKTQLNWPAGMAVVPERGELFVANDAGHSILVFRETDTGDVAPIRIIKGPRSLIRNPIGVAVDVKNRELWVANFGNHMGTVYALDAAGDVAPLRTIRAAPLGKEALGIGNPGAVALDSKRNELLVPN